MHTDLERQAERIFDRTLDAPTQERPAAIAAACQGNAALLARVQALFAADKSDGFLADVTADAAPPSIPAAPSMPVGEKPGDTIGPYKLLEQIGEGGFGVVFMAEQHRPVRRRVALKVIKLGMDTREVVARFEAERQALAMMDHPNIARVLDAGSTASGRPYFVMELVRGSPITEYADQQKLTTKQRVSLAAQVARAVQHAHSKGVIHRDLKPSNVLVTVTDDQPVPKVIDFGIAKATQAPLTDRTLFTQFRQMMGTPQYMSPEQADSNGSDLDTRSDVYSLGVLIYELLVGTTPMDAKALRSAAYETMRKMIRDTDVPRPATRLHTLAADSQLTIASARSTDVRKLGESIRGELDWIVMKALEKDRTRRYETAAALADDLNRYLSGDAVLAGPVSGTYRLKKTLKRYKAAAIIGGAIAACLLLGVAGTTWGLVREAKQRHIAEQRQIESDRLRGVAVAAERHATEQATLAETEKKDALAQKANAEEKSAEAKATLDFFTKDILAKASPNNTKDDKISKVLVDALITPALKTIDQRFADQPLVRASIQNTLAATLYDLGRYDLALPQAKAAWDARRAILGDDHPDTIAAMNSYGNALDGLGRYADVASVQKQLWDRDRRVLGDDHPNTIGAMISYGNALLGLGRYADAADVYKQAWDRSRRVQGDDHPDTIWAMISYGNALLGLGRHAEAADVLKQAWDRARRVQGDDHPTTLVAMVEYGNALDGLGRYAEAADVSKQAWDRDRRVLGEDHPHTLEAMTNYGVVLSRLGRYADAADVYKQAWDRSRRVLGDDHRDTILGMINYSVDLDHLGRYAEALDLSRQGWERSRRVRGEDDPTTILAMINYGNDLVRLGRYAEALDLYRQGWDRSRRVLGEDNPTTIEAMSDCGNALLGLGRYAEAADVYKQLWDRDRRVLGNDRPDTIAAMIIYSTAMIDYSMALNGIGRHAEAADTSPTTRPIDAAAATRPVDANPAAGLERQASDARAAGDNKQAASLLGKAIAARRHETPVDQRAVVSDLMNRAVAFISQRQYSPALSALKDAAQTARTAFGQSDAITVYAAGAYSELLDERHRSTDAAAVRAEYGLSPTTEPATQP